MGTPSQEEELICKYFNPIEEMYDLEYLSLAKTFLNQYLHIKISDERHQARGEPYYPSIEYTFAEMLLSIYNKCVKRWEAEFEKRMEEITRINEQLKKIEYLETGSLMQSLINFNATLLKYLSSLRSGFIYDAIVKITADVTYFTVSEFMLRRLNGVFRQPDKTTLLKDLDELIRNKRDPSKFLLEIQKYVSSDEVKRFIDREINIDERYVKRLAKKLKKTRQKYFNNIKIKTDNK